MSRAAQIAALNDICRRAPGIGGRFMRTCGVAALPPDVQSAAREAVETFAEFTPGNNPHGERDFGSFEIAGEKFFWKIDYYDKSLEFGSEDPSDPKQTTRVLTLMLASEY